MTEVPDLDLRVVLEHYGSTVVGRKATCVLHDDHTPSMSVDENQGLWYCHVCDVGGDALELIMKVANAGFQEACEIGRAFVDENAPPTRKQESSLFHGPTHRKKAWSPSWVRSGVR